MSDEVSLPELLQMLRMSKSAARAAIGLAAVASSGSASDLSTGTLSAARLPALDDYMREADATTTEVDTPVITQATGDTTALSSPVSYRPYICGTGSAVTGSDGQGDTYIRFGPGTYSTANGGSNDLAMYGSIKPGGDAQVARWPIIATFITGASNTVVEVAFYSLVNLDNNMPLIEVNGRFVSKTAVRRTVTGNGWKFTMTFPKAASRRITLWITGEVGLEAIRVPTGEAITKPTDTIERRVAFIGDSFCNGSGAGIRGGASNLETFAPRLARYMGADEVLLAGIGATGFEAGGATNAYYTRLAYVIGKSPHVLVVNGSINDGTGAGTIATAVAAFLASASSISEVYVIGTVVGGYEANHDAVRAATLAAGRTFVDMRSFIAGSGDILHRKGDGTADTYRLPADSHPTTEGHRAIARHAFRQIGF